MDIQLKRGFIEICVLKALTKGDSYGYKILNDISPYIQISESTLYPILKRLLAAGCLTQYSCEHNGRLRKYYSITEEGKGRIYDFLNEWDSMIKIYNYISEGEITND
ncbi:PadR family transcriptional regulator [Oscillospiraceae bacterium LCP25S3_E10]|nr:PadR family transcriptional regulator [Ruminococcus sp.]MDD6447328.1 PadR family transcriptional regulator [Ruminococcus sp.]MDY2857144.1 PadR family transcriptional regulator [Oscillospiraceae bacterium]